MIYDKLKIVRELQDKHHGLHVTGSLGLFLHGVLLNRDIHTTDIDLVSPVELPEYKNENEIDGSGDSEAVKFTIKGYKVDLWIDPIRDYDVIYHDQYAFRVSKLEQILFYKCKYALDGNQKQVADIRSMLKGV